MGDAISLGGTLLLEVDEAVIRIEVTCRTRYDAKRLFDSLVENAKEGRMSFEVDTMPR